MPPSSRRGHAAGGSRRCDRGLGRGEREGARVEDGRSLKENVEAGRRATGGRDRRRGGQSRELYEGDTRAPAAVNESKKAIWTSLSTGWRARAAASMRPFRWRRSVQEHGRLSERSRRCPERSRAVKGIEGLCSWASSAEPARPRESHLREKSRTRLRACASPTQFNFGSTRAPAQ